MLFRSKGPGTQIIWIIADYLDLQELRGIDLIRNLCNLRNLRLTAIGFFSSISDVKAIVSGRAPIQPRFPRNQTAVMNTHCSKDPVYLPAVGILHSFTISP